MIFWILFTSIHEDFLFRILSVKGVESNFGIMLMDVDDPQNYTPANIKRLGELLENAVENGDLANAKKIIEVLAKGKIKCSIEINQGSLQDVPAAQEFSIKVIIEDRESSGGDIKLKVKSTDTVRDLKNKVFLKHKFPVEVQKWIIGKRIPGDQEVMSNLQVAEGVTVYLYLISSKSAGLNKDEFENRLAQQLTTQGNVGQLGPLSIESSVDYGMMGQGRSNPQTPMSSNPPSRQRSMQSPGIKSLNQMMNTVNISGSIPYNQQRSRESQGSSLQSQGQILRASRSFQGQQGLGEVAEAPDIAPELRGGVQEAQDMTGAKVSEGVGQGPKEQVKNPGWTCPACTFINQPTRPGCEICGGGRPTDYSIPEGYQLSEAEKLRLEQEKALEQQAQKVAMEVRQKNYKQFLAAEEKNLVPNTEEFDCPICFGEIPAGEGVVLRECLHKFCKDCLKSAVEYNEEAILTCPHQDDDYACNSPLQEREVKALVPPDVFEKYLQRSLNTAENQEQNSFHCQTSNCPGWCIYEDMVNFFQCPVCHLENCLTCKAIHTGKNCKQYQEDLKVRSANDKAARSTQLMLQRLVEQGEAMHCPGCKVIVQKKDGCDWVRCSICKLEICWVTKGPRWGPLGTGDYSGGCGCRLGGQRCHPLCTNCH